MSADDHISIKPSEAFDDLDPLLCFASLLRPTLFGIPSEHKVSCCPTRRATGDAALLSFGEGPLQPLSRTSVSAEIRERLRRLVRRDK